MSLTVGYMIFFSSNYMAGYISRKWQRQLEVCILQNKHINYSLTRLTLNIKCPLQQKNVQNVIYNLVILTVKIILFSLMSNHFCTIFIWSIIFLLEMFSIISVNINCMLNNRNFNLKISALSPFKALYLKVQTYLDLLL